MTSELQPGRLVLAIMFITLIPPAAAATESRDASDVTDCAALPSQISDQLIRHPVTQIPFTQQTHISVLTQPLASTGEVFVHQQLGVVWRILEPIQADLIINEQGINPGDGFMDSSQVMGNLLREIIAGNFRQLTRDFRITSCQAPADDANWVLTLEPDNPYLSQQLRRLRFSGDQRVHNLLLEQANGNRLDVVFKPPEQLDELPPDILKLLSPDA